jgi:hypothetical protein
VPTTYIINQQGRIINGGYPDETQIGILIDALLKPAKP